VRTILAAVLFATTLTSALDAAALDAAVEHALASSPYVYVATERKDGTYGAPAEIWFMWEDGAVWVASPPTSWRAKRIRAGRRKAWIAVGRKDGPRFVAEGAFVRDPAVYEKLFATFARKYPDGWPKYETRFREGLKDGSRVLMRYRPVAAAAAVTASPRPPAPTAAP
jgi:hypothetical protein